MHPAPLVDTDVDRLAPKRRGGRVRLSDRGAKLSRYRSTRYRLALLRLPEKPMRRFALALTLAASLTVPAMATQKDPALDGLFERLKTVTDPSQARLLVEAIWETWTATGDPVLDRLMARGLAQMQVRNLDGAVATFTALIEKAPDFAEAWNKRATVYWMQGNYEASVADIQKTVALEPRHFGAWSGLGMIFEEREQYEAAIRAYEESIKYNPHAGGLREHIEELKRKAARQKT
jgi:tetratricopeptide (TPR) repeat protein